MKTNFDKVKQFMEVMGQEVKTEPQFPSKAISDLRIELIDEEFKELKEGFKNDDLVEIADALTDILYVVYGAGHALGIPLDNCMEEVHNSNMSKLGADGKPIYREDGKVMKGPNYFKPDLIKVLFED
jgi:predicted HAD superfamily Cof-like phosphohydrolase